MAGPWFTVQQTGSDWHTVENVWISNGEKTDNVQVQIRLELQEEVDEV